MRFSKSLLIAAVTVVAPFISHATPVDLHPTLSVDGFTFNSFTCEASKMGAAVGGCKSLGVTTLSNPVPGLQFNTAQTAYGVFSFDDAVLDYHVHSASQITNIGLDFNGNFMGYAISSVTETIKNDLGKVVGQAEVSCGAFVGCTRQDTIALNGSYDDLYVTKDINVTAIFGYSNISYIDQTFDPTPTPEPSSFMLLGSALIGVGGFLRRRSKVAVKA